METVMEGKAGVESRRLPCASSWSPSFWSDRWRRAPPISPSALRAPGATVQKLAGEVSFAEGPTADAAGRGRQRTWWPHKTPPQDGQQPDGSLTGKRRHCSLGSDGMTLDEEGNLYAVRLVKGANASK